MAPIWARSRVLGLRGSGTRSAVGKNVSLGLLEDDLSFVFTADLVVLDYYNLRLINLSKQFCLGAAPFRGATD